MIFACIQLFCCCLIIYLEFCSSDNIPDVSELPSPKKFHVLGMSVYDHPDDDTNSVARWWKWYMPSFYKMNLKGLKVDFTPQNAWNDSSSCQIRFYGFLKKLGSEGYWDGGHGSLMLPSLDKPLKCYYLSAAQSHVNIGHGSKHLFEREQAAKQLMAVAIYCPLPKKRKKVCEAMDTKRITNEVRLYPTGWEKTFMAYPPYEYIGSIFTSKQGRMQLPQIKPNMKKLNLREGKVKHPKVVGLSEDKPPGAPASVASDMKANKPPFALPSTELLVCTVQTFQNEMTGPMLYLFALHYCNLGFQVVVYDRYGRHVEFMRELIEECYVIYHPFTAYEVGLPGEYSAEKVKNEVSQAARHTPVTSFFMQCSVSLHCGHFVLRAEPSSFFTTSKSMTSSLWWVLGALFRALLSYMYITTGVYWCSHRFTHRLMTPDFKIKTRWLHSTQPECSTRLIAYFWRWTVTSCLYLTLTRLRSSNIRARYHVLTPRLLRGVGPLSTSWAKEEIETVLRTPQSALNPSSLNICPKHLSPTQKKWWYFDMPLLLPPLQE